MNTWLIRLAALGIGYIFLDKNKRKNPNLKKAADCSTHFKIFEMAISLPAEKKSNLQSAHNNIRDKVTKYFREKTNLSAPSFFIQGSYKMGTIISNEKEKSDLDLAVIFPCEPEVTVDTIHKHIKAALSGHTKPGILIKSSCVRINYVRNFHIDLPIYYNDKLTGKTYYGAKGQGWEYSEPKEFISWFQNNTKSKPQLIRVIKYLKAWRNYTQKKTRKRFPGGLVLTLWAVKFYESNARDDIAFFKTALAILENLNRSKFWEAEMPVAPHDDVMERLTSDQRSAFFDEFTKMVQTATMAIMEEKQPKALAKWKKVFGSRFNA